MGIERPSPDDPILPASLDRAVRCAGDPASALIGRDREIETLCALLAREQTAAACIWGQDGIGKTALALDVARRAADGYPDGPIYLDLQGSTLSPLSPHEALSRLVHLLAPQDEVYEDAGESAARYRDLLHGRRHVLILDDAAHWDQVRPLLPPPGSAVLITARSALEPSSREEDEVLTQSLALASLRHQDARALLARYAPRRGAELEPLVHVCRGVPLALCLAGGVLASEQDLDLAAYVRGLREAQARLPPVEAVLDTSLSLLSSRRQAQWRALALLRGCDVAAAAAVWEVRPRTADEVLRTFHSLGWIETSPGAPRYRYRMHGTLRAYALGTMAETRRARDRLRLASHYLEVLREAAGLCAREGEDLREGLALLDLEWDNIHDGQAWAAQSLAQSPQAGQLCSTYADVGDRCLEWRAPDKTQIRWSYDAVRSAREWDKPEAEVQHLCRLADIYKSQDKVDQAIAHYQQALSVAQQAKNRAAESEILGSLGLLYSNQGEHERSFGYFQQALSVARAIGDREGEGNWVGNLGSAYSALGEVEQALRHHQRAVAIARERDDLRGEGIWLGNLGNSQMAMGDPQAAIEAYRRAIEIARQLDDRREQARMWGNLGNACRRQNETGEALAAYEHALRFARELADRYLEGILLLNKAVILDQQGRRREAIACAEEARDALREAGSTEADGAETLLGRWR